MKKYLSLVLFFLLAIPFPLPVLESQNQSVYLAPPAITEPLPIVLTEEEKIILRMLRGKLALREINLERNSEKKIIRKIYLAFKLAEKALAMDLNQFQKSVLNLDNQIGRYYSRVYPIVFPDGSIGVGFNFIDSHGAIQRLLIKPKDVEAALIEEVSPDLFLVFKGAVELSFLSTDQHEKEWIKTSIGLKRSRKELPIPFKFIELYKHKITEFFLGDASQNKRSVTEHVEMLLLGYSRNGGTKSKRRRKRATFRELREQYPEVEGVLVSAFGDLSESWDREIPLNINPSSGDKFIVTLMNRVLQAIFVSRFRSPVDGVADFSHESGQGPTTVNELLQKFIFPIRQIQMNAQKPIQEVYFKNPPLQVFSQWIEEGGRGSIELEVSKNDHGYLLTQGVLIFDVDMTLLRKEESFQGEEKPPIFYSLIELLELGVPIRIISGSSAHTQYHRVLKPLQEFLVQTDRADLLTHIEMFTGTGSVRIYYSEEEDGFVVDKLYNPPISGQTNYLLEESVQKIKDQILVDLPSFLKQLSHPKEKGVRIDKEYDYDSLGDEWIVSYGFDFGMESPALPKTPFNLQVRDSRSLALHGWGFQSKKRKERIPTVLTAQGVAWLKKNHPDFWKRNKFKLVPGVSLRVVVLTYLDYLGSFGTKQQKIYNQFQFTLGGSSTVDITLKGLTKAVTTRFIFEQGRELEVPLLVKASAYFGDEFTFENGIAGNDLSMNQDPLLRELLKVHVGEQKLRLSAYEIFTRVSPNSFGKTIKRTLVEVPNVYFIFDSLDGNRNIVDIVKQTGDKRKHAYNVSLYYQNYPILAVSSFVDEPDQLLVTDLSQSYDMLDIRRTKVLLNPNTQDSSDQLDFVFGLQDWFQDNAYSLADNGTLGSFLVRRFLNRDENIFLIREGHVPLWKIGYYAHLFLRGAKTIIVYESENNKYIHKLFPLQADRLSGDTVDYGTVYAYQFGQSMRRQITQFLKHLRNSEGEQVPVYWEQVSLPFDIAI